MANVFYGDYIVAPAASPYVNLKTWKDGKIGFGAGIPRATTAMISWGARAVGGVNEPLVVRPWKAFGGPKQGKITGNIYVTNTSTPTSRLVLLFDYESRNFVSAAYADASTGYFEFNNLNKDKTFFVVGFDLNPPLNVNAPPTNNAVAQDNLTPA